MHNATKPISACESGWSEFDSMCYKVFSPQTFDDAKAQCESYDIEGSLPLIESAEEFEFVTELTASSPE